LINREGTPPSSSRASTTSGYSSENPGLSAFALEDGVVYRTYSCYARGLDAFNTANQLLDRAPRGRDEESLPLPFMWIRRHDQYDDAVGGVTG